MVVSFHQPCSSKRLHPHQRFWPRHQGLPLRPGCAALTYFPRSFSYESNLSGADTRTFGSHGARRGSFLEARSGLQSGHPQRALVDAGGHGLPWWYSSEFVSPGPALFRQERIGHLGARFDCLKFRTMHVNAGNTVHQEHLHHCWILIGDLGAMVRHDCGPETGRQRRAGGKHAIAGRLRMAIAYRAMKEINARGRKPDSTACIVCGGER